MSGSQETARQLGDDQLAVAAPTRRDVAVGWFAVAGIAACLLVMIGASLLRTSWQPQVLIMPVAGPPWQITARVSSKIVVVALWLAAALGAAGLITGLVAARRGLPVPVRALIVIGATSVAVLTLLPPVGSTDALDYAVYGHIAALGHSPYVMTPLQYRHLTHLRFSAPLDYARSPSYYGPLATAEQLVATKLGGPNLARTVLWLKVFNAVAFGAVAVAADRRFRADRAGRLRVHLLWTANPLLIWTLIASAHLDVLAASVGVAGLLMADRLAKYPRAGSGIAIAWALAAGVCTGAATDIKIDYVLFVLALLWALRRRPSQLLAALGGAAAVLAGSYAVAGLAAVKALSGRVGAGLGWEYYLPVFTHLGVPLRYSVPVAAGLMVPLAALALARMPDGLAVPSAVRAALALGLAWLLLWPHQYPWYSVMILCVLVFYPATRVDWVVAAAFSALSIASLPGIDVDAHRVLGRTLELIDYQNLVHFGPFVLLCAAVCFVSLCFNQRWQAGAISPAP